MNKFFILFTFNLFSTVLFGQTDSYEWYLAEYNGSLCNASIVLYANGIYRHESGCEASSYISFGTWTTKKDTVHFKPLNNKTYKVIDKIDANETPVDSISVIVLDKNGVNITRKISVGLHVPNAGIYSFEPDISSTKKIAYKRSNGKVWLKTLSQIFQQDFEISTDTANNFIIKLNIPSEWIYNSNSVWESFGEFKLLRQNGNLVSFTPDIYPQLIYERQKE